MGEGGGEKARAAATKVLSARDVHQPGRGRSKDLKQTGDWQGRGPGSLWNPAGETEGPLPL